MSFQQELENFSHSLQSTLQGTDQKLQQALAHVEKKCLDDANDDVNNFVSCMLKATKKIEKAEKKFEFRLAFFQNETYECFKQQSEQGQSYDKCKTNGKQTVQKYVDDLISSVKQ